jgi:hypothetical protein
MTANDQLLRRGQTVARAEAGNMSSFFQVFGDSIAVLAKLSTMERRDISTVRDMDSFVDQWRDSGFVGGVILTDAEGVVEFCSNLSGVRDTGASLADRDWFIWAKDQEGEGKYFVSKAVVSRVGVSKDKAVFVVASPVFNNGVFTGVIASSIMLQPFARNYLELIKVSDSTEVYLIDNDGTLLYSSLGTKELDINVFELWKETGNEVLIESITDGLNATGEGKLQVSLWEANTSKWKKHLVAYSPVLLGNRNWMLIMITPVEDAAKISTPFYARQIIIFLIVSLLILLFGMIAIRESQRTRKLEQPIKKKLE